MSNKIDWATSIFKDIIHNIKRPAVLPFSADTQRSFLITGAQGGIGTQLCERLNTQVNTKQLLLQTRPTKVRELQSFIDDTLKPQNRAQTEYRLSGVDFTNFSTISNISSLLDTAEYSIDADHFQDLDVVIHNAGLMSTSSSVRDIHAVNCISPFAATLFLLPELLRSKRPLDTSKTDETSRVVFVTSSSHIRSTLYKEGDIKTYLEDKRIGPIALVAYAVAKFNLLLVTLAMKRRLAGTRVVISSVHPGLVDTSMLQGAFGTWKFPLRHRLFLSAREAADAVLSCMVRPVDSNTTSKLVSNSLSPRFTALASAVAVVSVAVIAMLSKASGRVMAARAAVGVVSYAAFYLAYRTINTRSTATLISSTSAPSSASITSITSSTSSVISASALTSAIPATSAASTPILSTTTSFDKYDTPFPSYFVNGRLSPDRASKLLLDGSARSRTRYNSSDIGSCDDSGSDISRGGNDSGSRSGPNGSDSSKEDYMYGGSNSVIDLPATSSPLSVAADSCFLDLLRSLPIDQRSQMARRMQRAAGASANLYSERDRQVLRDFAAEISSIDGL